MDIASIAARNPYRPALYWTHPLTSMRKGAMAETDRVFEQLSDIHAQGSVSDQLFDRLSQLILSGNLPAGYTFPNETALCEQLHIGRTSLREAYKALELSGFITRTKRGTRVNDRGSILRAAPLRALFTDADQGDFAEFRSIIEVECAGRAASRANAEDHGLLAARAEACAAARAQQNYRDLFYADMEFHQTIARLGGNKLVVDISGIMHEALEHSVFDNFLAALDRDPSLFDDVIAQHTAIVDAIRARDVKAARRSMSLHLQAVSARTHE